MRKDVHIPFPANDISKRLTIHKKNEGGPTKKTAILQMTPLPTNFSSSVHKHNSYPLEQ